MSKRDSDIIKYHNDLADLPLLGFTPTEANIFMMTCFRYQQDLAETFADIEDLSDCYQEDIPRIRYSLSEFLKACGYKKGGPKKFAKEIQTIKSKLALIIVNQEDGEDREYDFPFFYEFCVDKKQNTFEAQIHKRAAYMLFGLTRTYTMHEINEFIEIKSMFAKRCYRILKKWRTVGVWKSDINEFRHMIGIPQSYEARDIEKQVLSVIKRELAPHFSNLAITKKYGKGRGNPIEEIIITFDKEPQKIQKNSGHECPVCGKPLVEKEINGSMCWCHEDGWKATAPCKAIFNSVADIKGFDETPKGDRDEPASEENDMYSSMPDEIRYKFNSLYKEEKNV